MLFTYQGIIGMAKRRVYQARIQIRPVFSSELDKCHWIWLNIDSKIAQMHDCMKPGLYEYDTPDDFMNVNVVIQR